MKLGAMVGAAGGDLSVDGIVRQMRDLEARGFHSGWLAHVFGVDAIGMLGIVARETERIHLGTAVVPTYPRHPVAMAQQALTTQAASGGRFHLGIGLSHQMVIENMFGMSYDKPGRHMRDYLQVVGPLLRGEPVDFKGEHYQVNCGLQVPGASEVPLLVAALGDYMLDQAGQHSDGTLLWMTGPVTIESHIVPKLTAGADKAGKPAPRVGAGMPIALTSDPDAAREWISKTLAIYGSLPSYRAMLDREGVSGPADLALVGDEAALDAGLARLADAGVTELCAAVMAVEEGAEARTLDYLASKL